MSQDYYSTLGVPKSASKQEIKKAYRKLAHKYHPDKGTGDEAKFKEANEAYQVLGDEKKRKEYDTYGRVFSGAGGGQQQEGGFGGFDFSDFGGGQGVEFDLGDIFGDIFGGGRSRSQRQKRGRDISIGLEIPFEDSIFGAERKVVLSKISRCDDCKGEGAEPGSKLKKCSVCQGVGKVNQRLGPFNSVQECPQCLGKGETPEKECSKCRGKGVVPKKEEIEIKIPAGIDDGGVVSLSGMGEAVQGGTSGDLYVRINVKEHNIFTRRGRDLWMDIDIKLSDALLGSEKKIGTLDGEIIMKTPSGVDSGEILRVKGKGVPATGGRGDLMVRVLVKFPKKISNKAKKLIEELRSEGL